MMILFLLLLLFRCRAVILSLLRRSGLYLLYSPAPGRNFTHSADSLFCIARIADFDTDLAFNVP